MTRRIPVTYTPETNKVAYDLKKAYKHEAAVRDNAARHLADAVLDGADEATIDNLVGQYKSARTATLDAIERYDRYINRHSA